MNFGEKLKERRKAAGLSQAQVAEKVGISQVAYSGFENGIKIPTLPVALAIARVLNTTLDALTKS